MFEEDYEEGLRGAYKVGEREREREKSFKKKKKLSGDLINNLKYPSSMCHNLRKFRIVFLIS